MGIALEVNGLAELSYTRIMHESYIHGQKTKVAILLRDLCMGGIERLAVNLLRELGENDELEVELVLCGRIWTQLSMIPSPGFH